MKKNGSLEAVASANMRMAVPIDVAAKTRRGQRRKSRIVNPVAAHVRTRRAMLIGPAFLSWEVSPAAVHHRIAGQAREVRDSERDQQVSDIQKSVQEKAVFHRRVQDAKSAGKSQNTQAQAEHI